MPLPFLRPRQPPCLPEHPPVTWRTDSDAAGLVLRSTAVADGHTHGTGICFCKEKVKCWKQYQKLVRQKVERRICTVIIRQTRNSKQIGLRKRKQSKYEMTKCEITTNSHHLSRTERAASCTGSTPRRCFTRRRICNKREGRKENISRQFDWNVGHPHAQKMFKKY